MPVQHFIHTCACEMLKVKEIPIDLRNYLDEVEMYANLAGGTICSRQVVAMALTNYMDRKAFLNAIDDMKERLQLDDE